jgi:coproporphyrinogen III oxidase-like Fe-S oxidoreductase
MMTSVLTPSIRKTNQKAPLEADLAFLRRRLRKPQRHRLLHGYPLAAAMAPRGAAIDLDVQPDDERGLLVGVLPHPFCNPAVAGCGFCTFAHESYHGERAAEVVKRVIQEIEGRVTFQRRLEGRPVIGLYFGGGTANLTPAGPFRHLCRTLAKFFDLSGAEVTLEGVPAYFVKRKPMLVDVLREEIPARHFRISMGIQTFDEKRLQQMGRQAFGDVATFANVVDAAHERGFTASADFLFNLPDQTLPEMRRDIDRADALGLDHLGLYHLVLFRGLGTPWSYDPKMLAGLPDNEHAAENWLDLRERLLAHGFGQTTLTNFERRAFLDDDRRFVYEEFSFRPDRFDMLGFGPGGISFAADPGFAGGLKLLNPDSAADYTAAVEHNIEPWDRYFEYDRDDLRVFYLTRRLAALHIDRHDYRALFGTDVMEEMAREVEAAAAEGLIEVSADAIRPTPRGMFFADSVASLLAHRRLLERSRGAIRRDLAVRAEGYANDNSYGHM